jgi:hypothetical protein
MKFGFKANSRIRHKETIVSDVFWVFPAEHIFGGSYFIIQEQDVNPYFFGSLRHAQPQNGSFFGLFWIGQYLCWTSKLSEGPSGEEKEVVLLRTLKDVQSCDTIS